MDSNSSKTSTQLNEARTYTCLKQNLPLTKPAQVELTTFGFLASVWKKKFKTSRGISRENPKVLDTFAHTSSLRPHALVAEGRIHKWLKTAYISTIRPHALVPYTAYTSTSRPPTLVA
jgi:hypothetical protein